MSRHARRVLAGEFLAGPHVRDACRRHFRDLGRQGSADFPFIFDADEAVRRIDIFPRRFRLSGGQFERKRFRLHESQEFIIGSIFGWRRQADGYRRFRRAYIEEGKGNGKSPLAAGVAVIMFCADREPGAEVAIAGPTKDQANIIFQDAVQIVDYSPELKAIVRQSGANPVWRMTYEDRNGARALIRPISKDKKKSGPRWSCGLIDEVHEHDDSVVLDMIERGFKWRRQPLLFMITNSGSDPRSLCGREHAHAIEVASGVVDFPETFSYVCALDKGDDWMNDPSCWPKANPLLGVTVTVEELDREVRQARTMPAVHNEIARLRFCVWTDADTAWLSRELVEPAIATFDWFKLHKGKTITQAVDLSALTDLSVLASACETGTRDFIERDADTGKSRRVVKPTFDVWVDAWTPKETLADRAIIDRRPYDVWERDGWLRATPGPRIRFDFIAARVAWYRQNFTIRGLAFDAYAFGEFQRELEQMAIELDTWWHPQGGVRRAKPPESIVERAKKLGVEPPEGLWMPGSVQAFETALAEQRLRIEASPVTISAIMSAVCNSDPFGNRWLDKRKATNRIDAAIAVVMVIGAAMLQIPKPPDLRQFLKNPVIVR